MLKVAFGLISMRNRWTLDFQLFFINLAEFGTVQSQEINYQRNEANIRSIDWLGLTVMFSFQSILLDGPLSIFYWLRKKQKSLIQNLFSSEIDITEDMIIVYHFKVLLIYAFIKGSFVLSKMRKGIALDSFFSPINPFMPEDLHNCRLDL